MPARHREEERMLKRIVIGIIVFCCSCVLGSMALAAPNVSPRELYREVPDDEESTIIRTSVVAVYHIATARGLLHENRSAAAKEKIDASLVLLKTVSNRLSTGVASQQIQIALKHLEYDTPKDVLGDLPPLFYTLNRIADYVPVDKTQRHLQEAGRYLNEGKKVEALRELKLADDSLAHLDIEAERVIPYLEKAREYVDRQEYGQAERLLKRAESMLQAGIVTMQSPLQHAKKDFWRAYWRYSEGEFNSAREYLARARASLLRAKQSLDVRGKGVVDQLEKNIDHLDAKASEKRVETESLLKATWQRVVALSERSYDYLTANWHEAETTIGSDQDLIEAKLHIADAEIAARTLRDPAGADKALAQAELDLQKVLTSPLTDDKSGKEVQTLIDRISRLRKQLSTGEMGNEQDYEGLRTDISALLRKI